MCLLNSYLFKLSKILEKYLLRYLLLLKLRLTLLKLTFSQICFKISAKVATLSFREWLINVQLWSVLAMPLMKRTNCKISFSSKKCGAKEAVVRFVDRRDWLAAKYSVLCELHFEEKYVRRGKKCTRQWSMNPVPTVYPQKLLSKPYSLPTQQTTRSLPRKRSFPDCKHFNNVI